MIKVLLIWAISFGVYASDLISEHNEQHAAENAAMARLFDAGCQRLSIKRDQRFKLIETDGEYLIVGNQLRVTCTKWAVDLQSVRIEWKHPKDRENGRSLLGGEIASYWIYTNGQKISEVKGNENHDFVSLIPNLYEITVVAVDSAGLHSRYSESFELLVE